jgi:hypothetical protein
MSVAAVLQPEPDLSGKSGERIARGRGVMSSADEGQSILHRGVKPPRLFELGLARKR